MKERDRVLKEKEKIENEVKKLKDRLKDAAIKVDEEKASFSKVMMFSLDNCFARG